MAQAKALADVVKAMLMYTWILVGKIPCGTERAADDRFETILQQGMLDFQRIDEVRIFDGYFNSIKPHRLDLWKKVHGVCCERRGPQPSTDSYLYFRAH